MEKIDTKINVLQNGVHYMTSPFGKRGAGMHNGIDLIGKGYARDSIVAFADGKVIATLNTCSGKTPATGNFVKIDHGNGFLTVYYHMAKGTVKVNVGDIVTAGTVIGYMGTTGDSTGNHLHFGIKKGSAWIDPRPYLEGKKVMEKAKSSYLTTANDITWELNHSYFPITETNNFVIALQKAKDAESPLYWGYYKLVNGIK